MAESLAEFWRIYRFPESTIEGVNRFDGIHPEDLNFIRQHYEHYFHDPAMYQGRKRLEIERFRNFMNHVNGRYVPTGNGKIIHDETFIDIAVPDHYHGNLDEAKLLMLLVNVNYIPGKTPNKKEFEIILNNMQKDKSDFAAYEFYSINNRLHSDFIWWHTYMYEPVVKYVTSRKVQQNDFMGMDYLPYRSINRHDVPAFKELLPSQQLALDVVKEAMKREINIIVRAPFNKRWFKDIPELIDYPQLFLYKNYVYPSLNIGEIESVETFRNKTILQLKGEYLKARIADYERLVKPFQ